MYIIVFITSVVTIHNMLNPRGIKFHTKDLNPRHRVQVTHAIWSFNMQPEVGRYTLQSSSRTNKTKERFLVGKTLIRWLIGASLLAFVSNFFLSLEKKSDNY